MPYYAEHAQPLKVELRGLFATEELRRLHERRPWRHFLTTARVFTTILAGVAGIWHFRAPIIWVPLAFVVGFGVFDCTVLLHEVVHDAVFGRSRPAASAWLRWLYAVPSGISASQFTRWHLDHHAELGSMGDPKRHYLSPRINARWLKLLYFTPALFFIYFRAARRAAASYPPDLQRRIQRERRVSIAFHLGVLAVFALAGGWSVALRAYVVPVFFVFPIAFALNRLGQHYAIDPTDVAQWSTLMKRSALWGFVYLNSHYHLEHHYFPGVPMYRLPALNRRLAAFCRGRGLRPRSYAGLLWGYLVLNRAPHTNWRVERPAGDLVQAAPALR